MATRTMLVSLGLYLLFCAIGQGYSAKILLLPYLEGSSALWMGNVAQTLASRGHDVTVLCPDLGRTKNIFKDFQTLVYKASHPGYDSAEEWTNQMFAKHLQEELTHGVSDYERISYFMEMEKVFYEEGKQVLFNNTGIMHKILSMNFDLAVVDGNYYIDYYFLIPYKFNIPYVSLANIWHPFVSKVPVFPMTPIAIFEHTDQMTFWQRMVSFILYTMIYKPPLIDEFVTAFVPEKPYKSLLDIKRDSKLFIVHNSPPLDYPKPTLPHIITLPSMGIKRAKALEDKELIQFINGSRDGFILVSLGTFVKWVPETINNKFAQAFAKVKQRVIWKYVGKVPENLTDNVKLVSWIPQNDLLAHPSICLFVTHCGNNGQNEAVYHGVPMLGTPVFADQRYNALRGAHKGYGLTLNLANFTADELLDKINRIVYNPEFKHQTQLASQIMKDDPLLPVERAVHWLEYVLKFGTDHLRSPAIYLPWYQYYMVDFFLIVAFVLIVCIFIAFYGIKFTFLAVLKKSLKQKVD